MKAPSDDHDEVVEINVVPMLDLAWNLLVVFMIVVTASVQGISVNLPKASAAASKIKPSTKAITITAEGTIFLDSFPVTLSELEARLRQYKAADPNLIGGYWYSFSDTSSDPANCGGCTIGGDPGRRE